MSMIHATKKSANLWRSYDYIELSGKGNPWRLLASAIVFQCACDCEAVRRYGEDTFDLARYAKGAMQEMSAEALTTFIDSDYLEFLLCWSKMDIEAVRENLRERLGVNETVSV